MLGLGLGSGLGLGLGLGSSRCVNLEVILNDSFKECIHIIREWANVVTLGLGLRLALGLELALRLALGLGLGCKGCRYYIGV